jgi:hypothetical protein
MSRYLTAYTTGEHARMHDGNSSHHRIDLETLDDIADRIVAANLTSAIYTRLNALQSHEDYDASMFDDIARDVVRDVMKTYSALLSALPGMRDNSPDTPGNGH